MVIGRVIIRAAEFKVGQTTGMPATKKWSGSGKKAERPTL